ncbi:hypothetical protein [Aquimarina aggregata]|uniref:hypothetical protein n=1 Tax=Aquimarina aggregata TaxID=1642818 RepID=UPI002493AF0F|nr:hypothetical protein [Aquimarina aggregata]
MINKLEIHQYVDACVERYKQNYNPEGDNEDFDFLMFRYSPSILFFETKYGAIEISKEIQNELMNMNTYYMDKCNDWINNLKSE